MKQRLLPPPLARYASLQNWVPQVGDTIVWAGWFRTWFGLVSAIQGDTLKCVFEGLPVLLVTLSPDEQSKTTHELAISKIKDAKTGTYAVLQHDVNHNATVWYV